MIIGRVVGETVATRKHSSHEGLKLLVVVPTDAQGELIKNATTFLAVDSVDAGMGDRVLLTTDGWAAMTTVDFPGSPIDAAILGVVDCVDMA